MSPAALLTLALLAPGDRITGRAFATRSEVIARHGMACTSQPLATQAALAILRKGGSAVDAAIAANAVQALVEPVSCGLGGEALPVGLRPLEHVDIDDGRRRSGWRLVPRCRDGDAVIGLEADTLRRCSSCGALEPEPQDGEQSEQDHGPRP